MKFELKLTATASCNSEADAKKAAAELAKFMKNPLVTATLQAYGIQLLSPPIIGIEKK
jgi:hypothetical protein